MSTPANPSAFVWYDLMTPDLDAAQAFYTAVMGWGTEDWNTPDQGMPYKMWTSAGKARAGMMRFPKETGTPPHWIAYISSANVDETVKQAKQLGAQVFHEPTDIPMVGRFAVLADPQGAAFAVFTPTADMAQGVNQTEERPFFSWHELHTTDQAKAFEFYSTLFGWEKTDTFDMGQMGTYQLYGAKGVAYGGMFNSPGANPPHWLLYALVDDADAAAKRVTENGGKVLQGPMDVPKNAGRVAQCVDPQGVMFAVHALPKGA